MAVLWHVRLSPTAGGARASVGLAPSRGAHHSQCAPTQTWSTVTQVAPSVAPVCARVSLQQRAREELLSLASRLQ